MEIAYVVHRCRCEQPAHPRMRATVLRGQKSSETNVRVPQAPQSSYAIGWKEKPNSQSGFSSLLVLHFARKRSHLYSIPSYTPALGDAATHINEART